MGWVNTPEQDAGHEAAVQQRVEKCKELTERWLQKQLEAKNPKPKPGKK